MAILILGFAIAMALRLDRYISLETIYSYGTSLDAFVSASRIAALTIFIVVYIVAVATSLPVSFYLNITGGYLFGLWVGGAAAWIGATIGATLLFMAARTALGGILRKLAGPRMARFEAGFREDAFNYLLTLRLIPLLPFFVVNLAPSFFDVKVRDYVFATMIGIIPVTLVFTSIGVALREAIAVGATLDPAAAVERLLFSPAILGATAGIIALSLLPLALKRFGKGIAMGKRTR